MSELAIVVIALLAISLAIYTIVSLINRNRAAVAGPRRWIKEEHTIPLGDMRAGVAVKLVRGHDEPIVVGVARCSDVDFNEQLEDLRVRAEDRLYILNRELPA